MTQIPGRKRQAIRVIDANSGAYVCDFAPDLNTIKLSSTRGETFLIDLDQLSALYRRGFDKAKSTPISRSKPDGAAPDASADLGGNEAAPGS
jgi:hypothetical protein